MDESEALEKGLKDGKVTKGEYAAVGEKDVLNMLKPLFRKHKVICVPKDGEIKEITEVYIDGYGKNKFRAITQLKTYFTLIDVDSGEERDIVGFGNGADSQDKGSGKAFTYAYKTALSKTFMLFSGEDTDNTHSDEITGSSNSEELVVTTKMLEDAINAAGYTNEKILERYKKDSSKDTKEIKYISKEYKVKYYQGLVK